MRKFDRIDREVIGNSIELVAIDDQEKESYLLRRLVTSTSASSLDGFKLIVSLENGEGLEKRDGFKSQKEMEGYQLAAHNLANRIGEEKNRVPQN
jgi:hypothetical protein